MRTCASIDEHPTASLAHVPDSPAAEIVADEALVRRLLADQAHAIAGADLMPLRLVAEGWDNHVWRLGERWAVRVPRRAVAAPLIENEQRWLPMLGPRITAASGLSTPVPLVRGTPSTAFAWPWSVVEWRPGRPALGVEVAERGTWAQPLGRALRALHSPAPRRHPSNPFRGVPLRARDDAIRARLGQLAERDTDPGLARAATAAWNTALDAPPWDGPPVWIHGDLHPGNLIAQNGRLTAIIDFGDLTAGDPAYDLAVAWLAFDDAGRRAFIEATEVTDAATWTRARGWAAAMGAILAVGSDDRPDYRRLGESALRRLT